MDYQEIRNARGEAAKERYSTPLDRLPKKKNLDKFRGCLIGGAAGDAMGYAVEFLSESLLFRVYGPKGITEYERKDGLARFSDDTQMTLFTANGLLYSAAHGQAGDSTQSYLSCMAAAYREWLKTQSCAYPADTEDKHSWLLNVPGLYAPRGPGNTCLSAIGDGCCGTIEKPINDSKGNGGVMRMAPVGLYFGESSLAPLAADLLGADAAALTHGHEMGYIPAAMLVHIVRLVSHNDSITLKEAVLDSMLAMEKLFPDAEGLPLFLRLIELAVSFSEKNTRMPLIHSLGEGWFGDETMAIAIYCALKYRNDFDRAILTAVNHGGDSDSTGAVTGNILGAYLGLSGIPKKYTEGLELLDVITEMADDLFYGCTLDNSKEAAGPREAAWKAKYLHVTYPETGRSLQF